MTFVLDTLREKPLVLLQMDDTSPLQDYSGYNATATISGGTPPSHPGLCKGATYAPVFSSTITAATASTVFKQGYEKDPFALAAWVRVVNPSGNSEQKILSNSGQYDGLTINGNVVAFTTKFSTAPEARCSYDLQQERAVYAVGVHTETKNSLYVNGVLVSEVTLTEAQQADTFTATSANLSTGTTLGNQKIAVNGLAIFGSALTGETILRQYNAGLAVLDTEEITASFNGDHLNMSLSNADVFLDQWWSTAEDWNAAKLDNVSVINDQLVPQFNGTVSVAGRWYDSFDITGSGGTSINGVQFNWDGEGATVEVSLDGTSWETVSRGVNVTTIPPGFNPTNKELQIRVSFPGGITNDTSYMDNLNAVGLKTGVMVVQAGRTITLTSAYAERDYPHLQYHDNWGTEIPSGATAVISADALEATVARTIGLWIKRKGTNPTLSMTGITYQNGAAATATLVDDQWTLMHVVAAADVTGTITINGPAQVGAVAIYDTALSAAQVASIYANHMGTERVQAGDNSVLQITEPVNAATIYAHDWSITAAG